MRLRHAGNGFQLVAHLVGQELPHAAAGGGERHLDVHAIARALFERRHHAFVDQAQLDDVDRDLRVIAGRHLLPRRRLDLFKAGVDLAVRGARAGRLLAQGVRVLAFDAVHAAVRHHGETAAQLLRDLHLVALLQGGRHAPRHDGRRAIPRQGDFLDSSHARYSVDAASALPSSALCSVCHTSVAHLTRAGNSLTPDSTSSLPTSTASASASTSMAWNDWNNCSTSSILRPLTASVMSDADAVEMAQPRPSNATSRTMPSATSRYTFTVSPHSGLCPSATRLAVASLPRFRGCRGWSKITSRDRSRRWPMLS